MLTSTTTTPTTSTTTTTASLAPGVPPTTLEGALSQILRTHLDSQQISQRTFAARLGVSQGTISFLLTRKRRATTLTFYARLARALGRRLSALVAELESLVDCPPVGEGGDPHAVRPLPAPTALAAAAPPAAPEDLSLDVDLLAASADLTASADRLALINQKYAELRAFHEQVEREFAERLAQLTRLRAEFRAVSQALHPAASPAVDPADPAAPRAAAPRPARATRSARR